MKIPTLTLENQDVELFLRLEEVQVHKRSNLTEQFYSLVEKRLTCKCKRNGDSGGQVGIRHYRHHDPRWSLLALLHSGRFFTKWRLSVQLSYWASTFITVNLLSPRRHAPFNNNYTKLMRLQTLDPGKSRKCKKDEQLTFRGCSIISAKNWHLHNLHGQKGKREADDERWKPSSSVSKNGMPSSGENRLMYVCYASKKTQESILHVLEQYPLQGNKYLRTRNGLAMLWFLLLKGAFLSTIKACGSCVIL